MTNRRQSCTMNYSLLRSILRTRTDRFQESFCGEAELGTYAGFILHSKSLRFQLISTMTQNAICP